MKLDYKHSNIKFDKNTVIIAGAGPGSKKLITLKLKYILQQADVVIYDALVNKSILNYCNEKTLLIYAGKTKKKSCSQLEINQLLVKYAKLGKRVLRLKGGDASFFSRASQEVEFLKKIKLNLTFFQQFPRPKHQYKLSIVFFLIKIKFVISSLVIKKLI